MEQQSTSAGAACGSDAWIIKQPYFSTIHSGWLCAQGHHRNNAKAMVYHLRVETGLPLLFLSLSPYQYPVSFIDSRLAESALR